MTDVRQVLDEDTLLHLVEHLPSEAADALLMIADGRTPTVTQPPAKVDPFLHPDAQRRFCVMNNVEELTLALEYPWEKWATFLHPVQREIVERNFNGAICVAGSAGTGKTIVALHRAVSSRELWANTKENAQEKSNRNKQVDRVNLIFPPFSDF